MVLAAKNMQTCEFIDSYNFLLCALAKLPRTFGLDEDLEKLYFPHAYNKPHNLNIVLATLPARRYYTMHERSPQEHSKFVNWYSANRRQRFCLKEALATYCEQDVRILREACVKFRQIIINETGLDPFEVSCTVASLTMTIYRHMFLPTRSMVNCPENGMNSL